MMLKHFYTPQPLTPGGTLILEENLTHRLARVLRLPTGAEFALFNGHHGLIAATLTNPAKGAVILSAQLASQPTPKPLALAICLPKKDTFETVLRQATELGVSHIYPLLSRHAVPDKFNLEKAHTKLVEAAEQCERLTLPQLAPLQPLTAWMAAQTEPFSWAFERLDNSPQVALNRSHTTLVGPEGGFSADEIAQLSDAPLAVPLSLGPTILRVDTAVVAALTSLSR